jgi:AcrR family transcriptional regulator
MPSTSSLQKRKTLQPQRDVGRQRVADLLQAAAAVIQERGFDAATMAEIAARADAKIGSLYRFFPNKEAIAEALAQRCMVVLQAEFDAIRARAARATPEAVADALVDLLVKLEPQTRAATALLEQRADWTAVHKLFRDQALAGVKAVLTACAPSLDDAEAEAVAAVVLNNMKTMVQMLRNETPSCPGAPEELWLMNRLYLATKLLSARS